MSFALVIHADLLSAPWDPDWIQAVTVRDLIVIGRDKRIRTQPTEIQHHLLEISGTLELIPSNPSVS